MTYSLTSSSLSFAPLRAHDERLQALAELLVGDADDGGLFDVGVLGEQVLDLAREHVLAAADDHLVVAAVDEQASVRVEVPDVAGAHQPLDDLLAAAAGVAVEDHLVGDEDAPGLAGLDLAAVVVEQLHDRAERRPPGGPGRGAQVGGRRDRRPRHLGRAVEVVEHVAERVHRARRELARERRAADRDHPQRARVVAGDRLCRQLEDALQHHRHDHQRARAVLGDGPQRLLGVEPAPQHERRCRAAARA